MTRDELAAFLPDTPRCVTHLGAASYAVPTADWIVMHCWPAFHARYWSEDLDKWVLRWECRDFARAFACFAQECWALTVGGTEDDGIAVGEIWYPPTPATGHAINPCITDQGLIFIEPQTGQQCYPTSEQVASRYFLRW